MIHPHTRHPGDVLTDMPDPEYRAAEGLNWSRLKLLGDSPKLYEYRGRHKRADSPAMALGRATHAAILEPEHYAEHWKVYAGARRGKAWEQFRRLYEEYEIITEAEAAKVEKMAAAVFAHDEAATLLAMEGVNERCAFWDERGRRMKAKIDRACWMDDNRFVVDVKTTRSVDPREFAKAADTYGYAGQMEHYTTAVEKLCNVQHGAFTPLILAVENAEPFDVGIFRISPQVREMAARYRNRLIDRLEHSERSGSWPGRVPAMVDLDVPRWSNLRS